MSGFNWSAFDALKSQIAAGNASAAVEPLLEMRRQHQEPAATIALADALARLGRRAEAFHYLQADIEKGHANHWTFYSLGHHHASEGELEDAARAFRSCHRLQGWAQSEERGYTLTHDYFSGAIANWQRWFHDPIQQAPIRILEIGSWQGGSTLWLLDHVIAVRGGTITCVDTWQGSSEHSFIASIGLDIESLFDANIAKTGLSDHVTKIKGRSQDVLGSLKAKSFDLIYVDGAHEASLALQDAIHAHRLLAPGGFLLFDDVHFSCPDPAEDTIHAINAFRATYPGCYREIESGGQLLLQRLHVEQPPASLHKPQQPTNLLDISTHYLQGAAAIISQRHDLIASAGSRCSTAFHLRRVFKYERAYPFDWWVTPFESFCELSTNPDPFSFKAEELAIVSTLHGETVLNLRWGVQHHHDFPRNEQQTIVPGSTSNAQLLQELNAKYSMLFERWATDLAAASAPLLIMGDPVNLNTVSDQLAAAGTASAWAHKLSFKAMEPEELASHLRQSLNPNLEIVQFVNGKPGLIRHQEGVIQIATQALKSPPDSDLEDHHDWVQPVLSWDLRLQLLANHVLGASAPQA